MVTKNRKFSKKCIKKSSPLKLLGQSGPNHGGMVLVWFPFRIVFDDIGPQPRWPLLLKIENERDPPRHHPCQVWFNLFQWFQRRRFKCDLLSKYA
jgi:hypothetical protein